MPISSASDSFAGAILFIDLKNPHFSRHPKKYASIKKEPGRRSSNLLQQINTMPQSDSLAVSRAFFSNSTNASQITHARESVRLDLGPDCKHGEVIRYLVRATAPHLIGASSFVVNARNANVDESTAKLIVAFEYLADIRYVNMELINATKKLHNAIKSVKASLERADKCEW